MRRWTLKAYMSSGGRDVLREWFDAQSDAVQAKFLVRMDYLLACERPQWKREAFDTLSGGTCAGLGEVRFKADRVQYRPIGFFGPGRMEFTILIVATERGGRFDPRDACDIAQGRKAEVLANRNRAHECDWLFG